MKRCTLHMCFICGIIRRLILWAIVHKKENHGSIVVGESRKFTNSFLTLTKMTVYRSIYEKSASSNALVYEAVAIKKIAMQHGSCSRVTQQKPPHNQPLSNINHAPQQVI